METIRVHAIYFSPVLTTNDVIRAVAGGNSGNAVSYDTTKGIKRTRSFLS